MRKVRKERKEGGIWTPLGMLILALSVLFGSGAAFAEWRIYKSAEIYNKEKNILRIDRLHNGRARVWLILKKWKENTFASKPPLYRVDRGPVRDLASAPSRRLDKTGGRWIRWTIWDGKGSHPPALLEIIHGKSIVFQYYPPDGSIKEATFSLEGAEEAIEEILQ
ncbi:MAG: hypothetical protein GY859_00115 [Desulfobacterales bacterium]|nr:hypothetical protein [Desulfobacterales bacterium]